MSDHHSSSNSPQRPSMPIPKAQMCSRTRWKTGGLQCGEVLVVALLSLATCVNAFNVDVNSKVIHSGPRGACDQDCMFGFAVAQHRESGTPWLLVGAPTAESGQPGVTKGGAVYKCKPDAPGSCDQIPFDINGNTLAPTGEQYEKKSGQWFGSLVQSSGEDGIILACAPRYIYYIFMNRMDPVGMCITTRRNFTEVRAHRPCVESGSYFNSTEKDVSSFKISDVQNSEFTRLESIHNSSEILYVVCDYSRWQGNSPGQNSQRDHCDVVQKNANGENVLVGKWGYHRQGSCQAGIGGAVAENGEQMFVGAPGSWYWQGQVFSLNTTDSHIFRRRGGKPGTGQVFSQNLAHLAAQHKTGEGSPNDDDSYLGYSVTTGEFNGDGDNADVAVGMPRGASLTGKILIYNSNLTNLYNLTGDQIGAYFGYSVAAGDLNGDGLDDLIIGSPMWTNYEIMGKYETGRVYVVYQDSQHKFKKFDTLDGENHKARFGLSVACAGNLNLDGITRSNPKGIEDLIVGAPYDGADHRGAIYIFLGSEDGILGKYAQVIHAADISSTIRTFGWSISAGMDLDQNKYPDLLVGAYDSSNAVYLRSAPVVHLDSKVIFLKASKQIDLERKKCTLRDGQTRVPCVDVEVTMRYDGEGVPQSIDLDLQYMLDVKKDHAKRMFFLNQEGFSSRNKTVNIRKNQLFKDSFTVYLTAAPISDKLTTLDAQVRYSLKTSQIGFGSSGSLTPVLGQFEKMAMDSISIQKDCGADNLCIPNLSLEASHMGAYVIGSDEKLEITTQITNTGEDAFNAMYYLQIPRGINYINTNSSELTPLCSPPTSQNNRTLKCEIGNPLPANSELTLNVYLQPMDDENQDQLLNEYDFEMAVNSSNPENGSDNQDNRRLIRIPVTVSTDWRVTGTSKPGQVEYNISQEIPDKYYFEDELGEEVFHVYDVKNRGPSTIQEAEVFILWPSFNDNGDHLLYLLNVDYDKSKAKCQSIDNINPLYVKTIGSRGYAAAQAGAAGAGFSRSSSSYVSGSGAKLGAGNAGGYSSSSSSSYSASGGGRQSSGGSGGYSYEYSGSSSNLGSSRQGSSYGSAGGGLGGETSYTYESKYSASSGNAGRGSVASGAAGGVYGGSVEASGAQSGGYGQGTQFGNTIQYSGNNEGSSIVAEGAEETKLSANEGGILSTSAGSVGSSTWNAGGSRNSYDYERRYENEYSSSRGSGVRGGQRVEETSSYGGVGQSSSAAGGSSRGTVSYSGWKLLDNGTYIRIYDGRSGSGVGGNDINIGGRGGSRDSGSDDSGWVLQPDGSYKKTQSNWSSWSSESSRGAIGGSNVNNQAGYGDSSQRSGSSYGSAYGQSGSETQLGGGSSSQIGGDSTNTIFNAARGPGDYHGTMRKSELEKEAGGAVFSATGGETRYQVDNTRYQGNVDGSYQGSTYQSGGSGGSNQDGSQSRGSYQGSSGSSQTGNSFSSNFNSGTVSGSSGITSPETSSSGSSSSGAAEAAAQGKWVWSEEKNQWEWKESTVAASFVGGSSNTVAGGGRTSYASNSGGSQLNQGGSQSFSAVGSDYSEGSSGYDGTGPFNPGGQPTIVEGTYAEAKSRDGTGTSYRGPTGRFGAVANEGEYRGLSQGQSQSGFQRSHGSSRGQSYRGSGTYQQGGSQGARQGNTRGSLDQSGTYFRSGHIGEGNAIDNQIDGGSLSGSNDSGWVLLDNGTYVRRTSAWSSESSYQGGVDLSQEEINGLNRQNQFHNEVQGQGAGYGGRNIEDGDHGTNSTGWIRQPDGTMVRKSSSWASWSKTVAGDTYDRSELEQIKRRLENQARSHLSQVEAKVAPSNIEPGFESQLVAGLNKRTRVKRQFDNEDFENEINGCVPGRCTLMRCTIGPLLKDDSVLFKIRARLFTETQIKNYADKVQISSKLVTRITRLPHQADVTRMDYQTHQVTTEVFPSELAEGSIPWWVWLLAALGGLLLLALIIFCLWRCGFFKRKRPTDSPEKQPLNRNGYH